MCGASPIGHYLHFNGAPVHTHPYTATHAACVTVLPPPLQCQEYSSDRTGALDSPDLSPETVSLSCSNEDDSAEDLTSEADSTRRDSCKMSVCTNVCVVKNESGQHRKKELLQASKREILTRIFDTCASHDSIFLSFLKSGSYLFQEGGGVSSTKPNARKSTTRPPKPTTSMRIVPPPHTHTHSHTLIHTQKKANTQTLAHTNKQISSLLGLLLKKNTQTHAHA